VAPVVSSIAGMSPGPVPPLMSLSGVIHFETNVFALGTAAFLVALVKKRGEAAARLAA
jgi:hypothetical protein